MKAVRAERTLSANERALAERVAAVRYWQHLLNEQLKQRAFSIPVHLAFGHEAIAVAVSSAMLDADQLVLTHRNVAYNLARAGRFREILDEYHEAPTGIAAGRLGSMNLANPARGVMYSSSILANNISVGCGLALANQMLGRTSLVTILTGDGAIEEGQFYEGLVFARTHRLTVLLVVENNDQSMASTIAERRVPILLDRVTGGVDIPFFLLRGNDVFAYAARLVELRRLALEGAAPVCLEVELAALNQHAGPTPGWPADPKNISIERGLIVEESDRDPLFVLKRSVGEDLFDQISAEVLGRAAGV